MPKPNVPHAAASRQARSPWPCRPVIAGTWRAVGSALRNAVLGVTPATKPGDPFDLGRETIAMRCLRIEALPGAYLVEALAARASGEAGIFRFMLGPLQVVPLQGHAADFGRFVAATPPGHIAADGAQQYIELFTSTLRTADGRFVLVQSANDVIRARPEAARQRAQWRRHVRPLTALGEIEAGRYGYEGTMAYSAQLSWVRLTVDPSGQVTMEDDNPLAPLAPAPAETFAGAWQIFEPAPAVPLSRSNQR